MVTSTIAGDDDATSLVRRSRTKPVQRARREHSRLQGIREQSEAVAGYAQGAPARILVPMVPTPRTTIRRIHPNRSAPLEVPFDQRH
jgi:hypothetical protein